jgi:mono/diheme cytochrome c family protein
MNEFLRNSEIPTSKLAVGSRGLMILRSTSLALGLLLLLSSSGSTLAQSEESASAPDAIMKSGRQIYVDQCVQCHGQNGEGVEEEYDEPVVGDWSLDKLARVIHKTMPEDEPELCEDEDARRVATYIYHAFYSEDAQQKRQPARVELSHLTSPQYKNTVADLFAVFRPQGAIDDREGLSARYYNDRGFNNDKKVDERVDLSVDYDFGEASPNSETMQADAFAIRWEGSIRIAETGLYNFQIKTQNGFRLWVNDQDTPLIDEWVSSGEEPREHTKSIYLLGGRVYPIRLHYFKFKEKAASISLGWTPPNRPFEIIPGKYFHPNQVESVCVVSSPFPPDDGSVGYARGVSFSKSWDSATTDAAIEVAEFLMNNLRRYTGARDEDDAEKRKEKLVQFAEKWVTHAFRRPLTEDQKQFFIRQWFESSSDLETALRRIILLTLKSPRFLYLDWTPEEVDNYDVAARLSYGIWDSLPDAELLKRASEGGLSELCDIEAQARRMVTDSRSKFKVRQFFHHYLRLEEAEDLSKDPEAYPDFNERISADFKDSLELFLEDIVWGESSDYREILLADYLYLNPRLTKFMGLEWGEDEPKSQDEFKKFVFESETRAGAITHPYLLSAFSYYKSTSPIHRGVFLTRHVLGRGLKPPPMAIQFMDGRFDPSLTMREKVTELTSPDNCMSCHSIINPLGFSLEMYDAVGRLRKEDNGKPVDSSSLYQALTGEEVSITGPRDVAQYAVQSDAAKTGFIEQLFHHMIKQPVNAYGPNLMDQLEKSFDGTDYHIRKLMVEIMLRTAPKEISKTPQLNNQMTSL